MGKVSCLSGQMNTSLRLLKSLYLLLLQGQTPMRIYLF